MPKNRLEAFSDGVLAIIITIMVLELKVPRGADLATLAGLLPIFLSYLLSFVYVGIYWNNHHHLFHATHRVTAAVLWSNLHLLFWLSLLPFATAWMGQNQFAPLPTALYGVVLLLAALAYFILQQVILADQGPGSPLAVALGPDWKGKLSPSFTSPPFPSPSSIPGSQICSTPSSPSSGSSPTAASNESSQSAKPAAPSLLS